MTNKFLSLKKQSTEIFYCSGNIKTDRTNDDSSSTMTKPIMILLPVVATRGRIPNKCVARRKLTWPGETVSYLIEVDS